MLILTRKLGEVIKIGDEVTVVIKRVNGNQVVIGIDAPKHIQIDRDEIYYKKMHQDYDE